MEKVELGSLKPGQKFKLTYPGARVWMMCEVVPGGTLWASTSDWLTWAVCLENGQLNEWEKEAIVIVVE